MQSIFKRYEEKYLISREQSAELQKIISQHMEPDRYGEYLVQNIYYDTENWDVIRASMEKPLYKEKMRLRCYGVPNQESKVFLELKKKYKGIVYKRRIAIPYSELSHRAPQRVVEEGTSQIERELDFYMKFHAVSQRIYITYHRAAYNGKPDEGLRVTFDKDVHFRLDQLHYLNPGDGKFILPHDVSLMEVKTLGGMPLWLSNILSENEIFPAAFSKYGICYTDHIIGQPETERKVQVSA